MKSIACAALIAMIAAPVAAQTAATPATAAPVAGTAATAKFSLDTPIETIAADAAGKAALDANFPGMTAHPAYDQFKSLSLKALQPLAQGAITDEQLKKAEIDLAAIK